MVGAVLVAALVAVAVLAPVLSAKNPLASDVEHGLSALGAPLPPSGDAVLGTDQLGRDVWARVVAGAGTSLSIAALATLIALVLGLSIGLIAGYAGGAIDNALMRLADLVLAFPFLLLAILLAALFREANLASSNAPVFLTLGAVGWMTMARVIRGKTWDESRDDYEPTVTAVIPMFNEGTAIKETLRSLLDSEYPHDKLTVICVDDCSSDDSYEHAREVARKSGGRQPVRTDSAC